MNKISYGAWGATIIWVGVIGFVTYTKRGDFSTMELNAIGDFLAGTVSPLALIWLVAGYLQQGKELKLNTDALRDQHEVMRLQRKEMAEQVKLYQQMVVQAEAQAIAAGSMARTARLSM
jgi:hypothetical protein